MSETYPRKTFAKRFSQDIFPSSVGIGCKGTTIFADMQEKSHFGAIFLGKLKSENGKRGSEDDNRDNNPVAPTLCHGKEYEATNILHYQNCWGTIYRHELLQRRMERMKRI